MINYKSTILILVLFGPMALESATDCTKLRKGQFFCPDPSFDHIDSKTQSVKGCTREKIASVQCIAAEGINCLDTGNRTFYGTIPCEFT
jgi:hypothetical protein